MHAFEILSSSPDVQIKATGSTRAGVLIAALKGLFAASGPQIVEDAMSVERQFAFETADFSALCRTVLNDAIAQAYTHQETCEDVQLSLMTDTKAQGAFACRAVTGFQASMQDVGVHDIHIQKNAEGLWVMTFKIGKVA